MARRRPDVAFGAVYEHRDVFGRPRFVGDTDSVVEDSIVRDRKENRAVRSLLDDHGGSSEVVWAGVGAGPIGHGEMKEIREAIVESRVQRNRARKLRGNKPYSRHGW